MFKLKFKLHRLVNFIFYFIFWLSGFLVGFGMKGVLNYENIKEVLFNFFVL